MADIEAFCRIFAIDQRERFVRIIRMLDHAFLCKAAESNKSEQ